jgi:branched-chain amino acid transport system substrate-binding protein
MTDNLIRRGLSRRGLLQTTAGLIGGAVLPGMPAFAEDKPAIGSYPAGVSGSTAFIGISVPRTGTYAVQGEDELKGYQLAIEHINEGHELIKKISPKTSKGVLGKELKFGVADSAAKPNEAVHVERRCGGAEQARPARTCDFRMRHFRLERHHRQGLRPLRLSPELLRPDCGRSDRPGDGT